MEDDMATIANTAAAEFGAEIESMQSVPVPAVISGVGHLPHGASRHGRLASRSLRAGTQSLFLSAEVFETIRRRESDYESAKERMAGYVGGRVDEVWDHVKSVYALSGGISTARITQVNAAHMESWSATGQPNSGREDGFVFYLLGLACAEGENSLLIRSAGVHLAYCLLGGMNPSAAVEATKTWVAYSKHMHTLVERVERITIPITQAPAPPISTATLPSSAGPGSIRRGSLVFEDRGGRMVSVFYVHE